MSILELRLGCFGHRVNNFIFCPSTENIILKVGCDYHDFERLMEYLDGCKLFDRPMFDFNAIRHLLNNIYNKFDYVNTPIWQKKEYDLYEKFIVSHRHCGIYIKLTLEDKHE